MSVKIVVVDDDRTTLALLEKALIMRGFWVYSASDGEEGYELVKQEMPDLVLSDMLMPKVHGLDLCKKIKTSSELAHIKVIMMTGVYKGSVGKKETEKEGGDGFIVKPLDMQLLLSLIFKLLKIDEEEFSREFVKTEHDDD
ncbi:MAG: response regulator [Candidatus Aminicenantes bacterium]|nr:response regulator [Candidatus Aminicenantes bacterium]